MTSRIQKKWTPDFDIASVPDDVLLSEAARRVRSRNKRAPRPKVQRQCEYCRELFGARELRTHLPRCSKRNQPVEAIRKNWVVEKITDPEEEDMRTYRYWQKQSPGARIAATWELTQAATSIRKVD